MTANDATPVPTMAAAAVPAGVTGYWRTAVNGTTVTQFPMRVIGLLHDYIYPGLPVILCEALDPLNKHSGPVGGMSGSPVFVDDKIIGAYAYGPVFQKDQALFMATPIDLMLQLQALGVPPLAALPASGAGAGAQTERERWQLAPLNVCGMSPAAVGWLQRQLQPYGIAVMDGVVDAAGQPAGRHRHVWRHLLRRGRHPDLSRRQQHCRLWSSVFPLRRD
ncbi:MAG: hypothetical protein NTV22_10180 [bacterium]|nr:hypothetical protein [bacterium]